MPRMIGCVCAIALATVAASVKVTADPAPTPVSAQGAAFVMSLMANDVRSYLTGGKHLLDYGNMPRVQASITASQLAAEYASNELAADRKYKDKMINVNGTIKSIEKDITGDAYVSFASSEYDMLNVEAYLAPEMLQRGRKIYT